MPKKFELQLKMHFFDSIKRPKNHYYIRNTKTILNLVMLLFVLEWTHRLQRVPYGHRKDYKINTHTVNYSKNPGYSKNKTQIHSVTLTETWFKKKGMLALILC